jgi:hypothetical protein
MKLQESSGAVSKSMNTMVSEFANFFVNESSASGITHLFKQELRYYEKQEKVETAKGSPLPEVRQKILDTLSLFNAHTIPCLEDYRKESKKTIVFDKLKLKMDAPHVEEFLETYGCLFR